MYNNIELPWKPVLNPDGSERLNNKQEKIVETGDIVLEPSGIGKFGGWRFKGVDGHWMYNGSPNAIVEGVPILVNLRLGNTKETGTRYMDIVSVKPTNEQPLSAETNSENHEQVTNTNETHHLSETMQGLPDIGTSASIREQSFFNHLSADLLPFFTEPQQAALLSGYYDTALHLMRENVRKRALKVYQNTEILINEEQGNFSEDESELVQHAEKLGAKIVEEKQNTTEPTNNQESEEKPKQTVETDEPTEEVQDLPW